MKKFFRRFLKKKAAHFTILLLSIFCALPAFSDPFPVLSYYFEANERSWNSATVSITIENNSRNRLLCILPGMSGSNFQFAKISAKISNFSVTGEGLKEPAFKQINDFSYLIFANNNRTLVISYDISNVKSIFFGSLISRDFVLLDNPAFFMKIREYKDYPIKLTISVPYGWKLATGLPFAGDNFEYSALNYNQLAKHPLFLAPFKEIYFTYYDQNHFVIFNKNTSIALADKITQFCQKIFRFHANFFRKVPHDRNFFIFNFCPRRDQIASESFNNASIFFLPKNFQLENLGKLYREISSSLFQQWYHKAIKSDYHRQKDYKIPPDFWFWVGISRYYGELALLRSHEIDFPAYVQSLLRKINEGLINSEIFQSPLFEFKKHFSHDSWFENFKIFQLKSELICAILDLKIRSVTQNKKSLDDIALFLNAWYQFSADLKSDEFLLQLISSLTNVDFTTFFDMYVDGNQELPFSDVLGQVGIFIEAFTDTIPDFSELKVKKNLVLEMPKTSIFARAGLKSGDRLISINNFSLNKSSELRQVIDSLQVGEESDFMISRDGLSLLVNIKIPGKQVRQFRLLSLEPKTEFQAAIREDWMK